MSSDFFVSEHESWDPTYVKKYALFLGKASLAGISEVRIQNAHSVL